MKFRTLQQIKDWAPTVGLRYEKASSGSHRLWITDQTVICYDWDAPDFKSECSIIATWLETLQESE